MKKIITRINMYAFLLSLQFINICSYAQQYVWANKVGSTSDDRGKAIVTDVLGNIYTTGHFTGTVDFDPGPSVFTLTTSSNNPNVFICKTAPNGNFMWAKNVGISTMIGSDIKLDAAGNIYIIGISAGGNISKFDPSGNLIFTKNIGSTVNCLSITIDLNGSIYSTGYFTGTPDFDPGVGTFNLTSTGGDDIFVCKIKASGNFGWAKKVLGTTNQDHGNSIATDAIGNIYTTGYAAIGAGNSDVFITKHDSLGTIIWTKNFQGPANESGTAITINSNNEILTTGIFYLTTDFLGNNLVATGSGNTSAYVCKLTTNGSFTWVKNIGGNVNSYCIITDPLGNVYTSGNFNGTVDFDPGIATYTVYGGFEGFIHKLDNNGNFTYIKPIQSSLSSTDQEYCSSICLGLNNVIFATGYFSGTTDFDPGSGTYNLTCAGNLDMFIFSTCNYHILPSSNTPVCLNQNLNLAVNNISSSSYNWSGPNSFNSNNQNPSISNVTNAANGIYTVTINNSCIAKETLSITVNPLPLVNPSSNSPVCEGKTLNLIVNSSGAIYNWTGPNSYTYSSTNPNPSITNVSNLANGNYSIIVTGTNGCQASNSISVIINPKPIISITASTNTICAGAFVIMTASGANTYSWTGGFINGTSFYPSATQTYTATGTDLNGCSNTALKTIVVNPLPSATISGVNNTKCSGSCNGSASVIASSGTPPYNYLWYSNASNQTTATATLLCQGEYSVRVSDSKSCEVFKNINLNSTTVANTNVYLTNLAAVDQINVSTSFAAYYSYNLPTTILPPPSNPRNFVDPGKKARFKVECTNQKSNGLSIVSGICKVRSNNQFITITDSSSALNNVGWNNTIWSADEFEIDIDPNTPSGTNAYIDFVVQESGQDFKTTCIAIPITPLVYSPTTLATIDDDNNPDSQGNNDDICNPGETIEFYPWLDNKSKINAEYVRGRFENLDNHSFINIWNNIPGVSTTVYSSTWWNYFMAQPQIVNSGSANTTPEYDFVFDYNNASTVNNFKLYLVMAGGFKLFGTNALSLVQWTLPYTFNNTGAISVNELAAASLNINVTPNPSSGIFQIETILKDASIKVFNLEGQIIFESTKLISEIDLSNSAKGIYFLQLKTENKIISKKIIIQ